MTDTTKRPLPLHEIRELRYGENPWQGASFFTNFGSTDPLGIGNFNLESGEIPSATNLTDVDRALHMLVHSVAALRANDPHSLGARVAIAVKHGNPCGAGHGVSSSEAARKMIRGDLKAIMGATIILNSSLDDDAVDDLLTYASEGRRLLDVVVAADFTPRAVRLLERKNGKCRILSNPTLARLTRENLSTALRCRGVRAGYVVQDSDARILDFQHPNLKVYGPRISRQEEIDMAFASALCRTSNSNTITLVKGGMLIGQGVAQTRRDRAARLAVQIAKENNHLDDLNKQYRAIACSDSFFPFADGVEPLIEAGVKAVFATSGALRDEEVQRACIDAGVTLYQLPDTEARMFFGH